MVGGEVWTVWGGESRVSGGWAGGRVGTVGVWVEERGRFMAIRFGRIGSGYFNRGYAAGRKIGQVPDGELVAIAGHYKVLEDIPKELRGKAVQSWLDKEQLNIAALD